MRVLSAANPPICDGFRGPALGVVVGRITTWRPRRAVSSQPRNLAFPKARRALSPPWRSRILSAAGISVVLAFLATDIGAGREGMWIVSTEKGSSGGNIYRWNGRIDATGNIRHGGSWE